MPNKANGWDQCKRDIYQRFDTVDKKLDEFNTTLRVAVAKIHQEEIDRAVFKKEVSFRGLIAGTIPTLVIIILWVLKELLLRK
ncbi:MAG: hypothetical protein KKH44_02980 [Bacteroidetes bacterium]|nr:hypothetical protein [Bacteroidota bacterium]